MSKIKSKSVEYETHKSLHRKSSLFTNDEGTRSSQYVKMLDFCYDVMQLADQDVITYTAVKALSQYIFTFIHVAWKTFINTPPPHARARAHTHTHHTYTQHNFFCWRNKHIIKNETHVLQQTRTNPLTNFLPTITLMTLIFNCKMVQTTCHTSTQQWGVGVSILIQTHKNYINCAFIKKQTSVSQETYVDLLLQVVATKIEVR